MSANTSVFAKLDVTFGEDLEGIGCKAGMRVAETPLTQLGYLGLDTSVPESVRAMAEKSVAQTREIYDRSKDALDASIVTFERTFDAAGQGATAFNRKIIDIARRNVDASFDLATSLAGAKSLAEIVELQAAHWQKQFDALANQAEEVRALSTKVTADAAEPIKSQMAAARLGR